MNTRLGKTESQRLSTGNCAKYDTKIPESTLVFEVHNIFWEFWNTNRSPNSWQKASPSTFHLVVSTISVNHREKIKDSEKINKNLYLFKSWKTIENRGEVGALGTLLRGLEKRMVELEIGERIETLQTAAFLRSARILRKKTQENWRDLPSLGLQRKTAR